MDVYENTWSVGGPVLIYPALIQSVISQYTSTENTGDMQIQGVFKLKLLTLMHKVWENWINAVFSQSLQPPQCKTNHMLTPYQHAAE